MKNPFQVGDRVKTPMGEAEIMDLSGYPQYVRDYIGEIGGVLVRRAEHVQCCGIWRQRSFLEHYEADQLEAVK